MQARRREAHGGARTQTGQEPTPTPSPSTGKWRTEAEGSQPQKEQKPTREMGKGKALGQARTACGYVQMQEVRAQALACRGGGARRGLLCGRESRVRQQPHSPLGGSPGTLGLSPAAPIIPRVLSIPPGRTQGRCRPWMTSRQTPSHPVGPASGICPAGGRSHRECPGHPASTHQCWRDLRPQPSCEHVAPVASLWGYGGGISWRPLEQAHHKEAPQVSST